MIGRECAMAALGAGLGKSRNVRDLCTGPSIPATVRSGCGRRNLDIAFADPTVCEIPKIAVLFDLMDVLESSRHLTMASRVMINLSGLSQSTMGDIRERCGRGMDRLSH